MKKLDELIEKSTTRQFKAIFPYTLNANNTLFGGQVLKWMDEVAYLTATRFTREKMFTINTEKIKFIKTIQPNTIIEIIGKVEKVELIRVYVKLEIYCENMYDNFREKCIEGSFVFAALNENNKPKKLSINNYLI